QASVETGAGRYSGPPAAALQVASGDVRLAITVEVADFDIDPGGARAPSIPAGIGKAGAVGQSHPPLAAFRISANDVGLAVAVEIADLHINPSGAGVPARPHRDGEGTAIG